MTVRAIRLEGVSRRFGAHMAVRNVSLELRAGELTLLLGPNGAGKTTLMSLLSTVLLPTRGRMLVDLTEGDRALTVSYGELALRAPELIGLVSHASLLYQDLTGRENLHLFAQLYGMSLSEARERSSWLLHQVDLEDAADRRVSTYSRGMCQRLSIARAILQDPPIVLLDEPYTGLDRASAGTLNQLLESLKARGRLMVLITHRLDMPSGMVERAILLKQGGVVADEAPGEHIGAWYERRLMGEAA